MNQLLKYLNFAGIIVLALLCAGQWKTNSRLEAALIALHQKSDDQAVTIAKQTETLKENAADLDDFRQRLSLAESRLRQAETDLVKTRQQRDQLVAERDELTKLRERLLAAVAQRDQVLKEQTDVLSKQVQSIHTLEDQRNQSINKYNELVARYNTLVSGQK
jgi:septal ring factor EnvC (AmiA/AmiB activator)